MGKSRLALELARRFDGEIINADSRQVYRRMDIGTAKPSLQERSLVPHYLFDILDLGENFDVATFVSLAQAAIKDITARGHLPIIAGGTGQYVWALVEGWQVPAVLPDPAFRRQKLQEAERHGPEFVYQQLQTTDPLRAAEIDPRNLRRVIRALEVKRGLKSGREPEVEPQPLVKSRIIGLTMERQALYRRIDDRVDRMMLSGLEKEVRDLAASGYLLGKGPLSSPGYRELGQYLDGQISLEEAVQRTKFQTHRLVRRQYTWFKPTDSRIQWLNAAAPDLEAQAQRLVEEFLSD